MKKLAGLTLALALCAGALAGCGSVGDKAADASQTDGSAQTQSTEETTAPNQEETEASPSDQETEEPAEGEPGFDSAALAEALSDVCNVGPGASGSNLRAVKAAGELVNFAALNWNDDSAAAITEAVGLWFENLAEEEKEEFHLGREIVESQAEAISATPTSTELLAMLSDAGLEIDFGSLDLSHTGDFLQAIRSQTGAVTEND